MSRIAYKTLRQYVEQNRVTQQEVADLLGVSPSAVSLYVRQKRVPRPEIARRIAKLGVDVMSLLERAA